jgi:uncharacterized lipoprotein YajG
MTQGLKERLKDDEFFDAVNEKIADTINKLIADQIKVVYEAEDLKITGYWVGDQIRIDIK